jgi:hypothetical protein
MGQFDIGDSSFGLEFRQQTTVDIIKIGHIRCPC